MDLRCITVTYICYYILMFYRSVFFYIKPLVAFRLIPSKPALKGKSTDWISQLVLALKYWIS